MNILVLSDSHGRVALVEEAIARVQPDVILFAGDGVRDIEKVSFNGKIYVVRGNCDWGMLGDGYSEEELITIGGVRIFLTHGHTYHVKSGLNAVTQKALRCGADILVFGHTHEPVEQHLTLPSPLLVCNPGSLGYDPHSFATLTLRNGQVLCGHGQLS